MTDETLLPRKKISPDLVKLYTSLGSLLKEYRQWRKMSQETVAEFIQISTRELQNWEADRRRARIENLHDLSEFTGIPMQVLVALNADQPVWYSLRKRLFAYSLMEKEQFSSHDFFRHCEKSSDDILIHVEPISANRHIDRIISCHRDLYGNEIPLRRDVIETATTILPDQNIIAFDCWGHYVGHQVCLPIKMDVYEKVKKHKIYGRHLTAQNMNDISDPHDVVIFHYSSFFASVNVAFRKFLFCTQGLSQHEHVEDYLIAICPATKESRQLVSNLGWDPVEDFNDVHSEIYPTLFETKWYNHARSTQSLGWVFEHPGTQVEKEDADPGVDLKKVQNILSHKGKYAGQGAEKHLHMDVSEHGFPVSVGKIPSRVGQKKLRDQHGKTQSIEIETKACKNPACSLYGKTDRRNIISNGTYRTKDGTVGRRYYCNICGKSFCNRTGTIFYGLRSPEEKMFKALKLLTKGIPLQDVAKSMGVKFDTVRRWLSVTAEQRETLNAMLLKEPDVSQNDLEVFWASHKKGPLRKKTFPYNAPKKDLRKK